MLKLTVGQAYTSAYFGTGSGPIYLSNVECGGSEASLLSCISDPIGVHNCDHSQDAGVRCEGTSTGLISECIPCHFIFLFYAKSLPR